MGTKRKTPLQVQGLEQFYSDDKYPSRKEMEDLAVELDLTFKQVRTWFIEKRRRDKCDNEIILPSSLRKKHLDPHGRDSSEVMATKKMVQRRGASAQNKAKEAPLSSLKYKRMSRIVELGNSKRKDKMILLQDLLSPDYILKKVFRKDGPPLGAEFDFLPSQAFCRCKESRNSSPAFQEDQRAIKRRKVSKLDELGRRDCNMNNDPTKKHGMGKGLMTVWRVINPNGGKLPTGIDFTDRPQRPTPVSRKPPRKKGAQQLVSLLKQKKLAKLQDKRKPPIKRRPVKLNRNENLRQPYKEKCELSSGVISQERLDQVAMLMDDEQLELRYPEARPSPSTCCDHITTDGLHGCSLCRDMLTKFPPSSVKMKQPFGTQPWDSSPEIVKKLFKVVHFLYTYSSVFDICFFTLDEFAQAFHDKDSLLLGKVHVALLKLLLSHVERELSSGSWSCLTLSCNFLALLQTLEDQEFFVELWNESLNPLTWTEIMRQVLVAAGFGSKQGASRRESLSKEMNLMVKYGLRPSTLKGELFRILLDQGINGLKVSQLAMSPQITELNLGSSTEELERLISSTLSSDITLFEKISSSAYRLRISSSNEAEGSESDSEDSGSVDDNADADASCSSNSDSETDSENHRKRRPKKATGRKIKMLTVNMEIDESHPGEPWLLGLMEGEYSDLSIEEKLNALVALIDLVSAGYSIRMEDPTKSVAESVAPSVHRYGSGAKIKRSTSNQHNLPRPSWIHGGQTPGVNQSCASLELWPIDSSSLLSKSSRKEISSINGVRARETEYSVYLHPMQSVYLGSDRRYNRYWLFLGPCDECDPGHRSVYFESSEDGHWEVIDTDEALRALLSVLDDRGKREALLIESLEKREAFLCQAMSSRPVKNTEPGLLPHSVRSEMEIVREDSSSPVSDVDNTLTLNEIRTDNLASSGAMVLEVGRGEEQNKKLIRLQEFDKWIWNSFYLNLNAVKRGRRSYLDTLTRCESCHDLYWRDEKHCKVCHTTFELDFDLEERYAIHAATCKKGVDGTLPKHKILSSQLQSLKAAIHAIESVMPPEAVVGAWSKSAHKLWVKRLRRTSSLAELLQVLADFVGAINEEWLYQLNELQSNNTIMDEIIACFPTMPQTSSAIALWLVKLDALISPCLEAIQSEERQTVRTRSRGTVCS